MPGRQGEARSERMSPGKYGSVGASPANYAASPSQDFQWSQEYFSIRLS